MLTVEDFRTTDYLDASDNDMRSIARQNAASELRTLENLTEEQRTNIDDDRIEALRQFLAN